MRRTLIFLSIIVLLGGLFWFVTQLLNKDRSQLISPLETNMPQLGGDQGDAPLDSQINSKPFPLTIQALRQGDFPGSDVTIEEKLSPGTKYSSYLASYQSEGLKIYALLTIPNGIKPQGGWPAIIFNHGYIPPTQYKTTERYAAYVDAFARNGHVVFKPDYRGHGDSQGLPAGGYGSNGYTIDVLNAVASIKQLKSSSFWQARNERVQNQDAGQEDSGQARMTQDYLVNPEKIGMWGHSMGGFITLRNMVVSKDIKAGVIWGGVVASYPDLLNNWRRRSSSPPPGLPTGARRWRQELTEKFGTPEQNPEFWNSISANSYLDEISGPLQLHHGTADASVPIEFSQKLASQLQEIGKEAEIFTYQGDDHNLSRNLSLALNRSVKFFDKYLKD